jgi:hypothetical protein
MHVDPDRFTGGRWRQGVQAPGGNGYPALPKAAPVQTALGADLDFRIKIASVYTLMYDGIYQICECGRV